MLTIGQFARLAQVSLKLLRHYDRIGLLHPVHINRETGYRYYAVEQLDRLNRILALQNLGMSLKEIERLLDERVSPEELRGMLRMKQARLRHLLEKEAQRLREVETRLAQIESADPTFQTYDIALKSTTAVQIAGVRQIMTDGDGIGPLFFQLHDVLTSNSVRIGESIGLYDLSVPLDTEGQASETFALASGRRARCSEHPGSCFFDLEAVYTTSGAVASDLRMPDGQAIHTRELPAEPVVAAIFHRGAFSTRYNAYLCYTHWADANDYLVSGAIREVYLRYVDHPNDPRNMLEILIPVVKKGNG